MGSRLKPNGHWRGPLIRQPAKPASTPRYSRFTRPRRPCLLDTLPERHIEGVAGGLFAVLLFAVLNEQATHLNIGQERLAAMEQMWLDHAYEFDLPFSLDCQRHMAESPDALHWQRTLARFCQNVSGTAGPTGSGPSTELLSFEAGNSVTHTFGILLDALEEISRLYFRDVGRICLLSPVRLGSACLEKVTAFPSTWIGHRSASLSSQTQHK